MEIQLSHLIHGKYSDLSAQHTGFSQLAIPWYSLNRFDKRLDTEQCESASCSGSPKVTKRYVSRGCGVLAGSSPLLSLPSEHLGTIPDMFDQLRSLLKCYPVTEDFPDHHF